MRDACCPVSSPRTARRRCVGVDVRAGQANNGGDAMPRYVVEREFPDGLEIPVDETGAKACLAVVESNLADQVTWVHSYVSTDKKKTFCVYDGPSPEAIRRTARRSKLPVGHITEVRV